MSQSQRNYYTNPAFSQQSEFYYGSQQRRIASPPKRQNSFRQPPVGAQTTHHLVDSSEIPTKKSIPKPKYSREDESYEEQEFYEEMIVDDSGLITDKKVVVVHSQQNSVSPKKIIHPSETVKSVKYVKVNKNGSVYEMVPNENRYEEIPDRYPDNSPPVSTSKYINHRYEYIPMRDHEISPQKSQKILNGIEAPRRIHKYTIVQTEEETELTNQNNRYALVPVDELRQQNRYEYLPDYQNQNCLSPRVVRHASNPAATQKLHEILTTPKKSSQKPYPPATPVKQNQFRTPPQKTPQRSRIQTPKSQQKLNYTLSTRQVGQEKRHTAIVAPICSSPVQSVYSETTYSNKTESWMNLSIIKPPVQATLAVAAIMMILCGSVTSGLCFYMVSVMGRLYYLDFGIVSGFACLLLGILGFRSRSCYWLPNRNYISGYIVLSVFSLLTCVGLLVLLFMQPKPGTPLADMTSGAVCGISVLSLILAATGVLTSYCCKYPPPDNRVQHCARGFSV